jgi:hypothetical protein
LKQQAVVLLAHRQKLCAVVWEIRTSSEGEVRFETKWLTGEIQGASPNFNSDGARCASETV